MSSPMYPINRLLLEGGQRSMLVQIFNDQVNKFPENIAVKAKDKQMTYSQLNKHANQIARKIIEDCTKINHISDSNITIGLLFEHGTDMIVGMIGALKTGYIYLPLDPSYPEKRLAYMVEHSDTILIVTNNENLDFAKKIAQQSDRPIHILNIDQIDETVCSENVNQVIHADQKAYILYTSGSTGKPKGVIQTHQNIWHFIKNYTKNLSLNETDRLTLFSAFSHDAAIMDIYGGLVNGATLYPLNIKNQVNVSEIANWLKKEKITIWHSVPTVYRYFIGSLTGEEIFPDLRFIVLGGESVLEHDVTMFKKLLSNTVLVNLYGQSESSYNSSQIIGVDTSFKKVTLGTTVEDTELLIVTDSGELASPLQIGEIIIASNHVALGYWKDPERTEEVFKLHPDLGKLYRTGDLGRLLVNGRIEYIGRKDFQVKIRGYRIELGEVESHLLSYSGIKEGVVIVKEDLKRNQYLSAFIVADENVTISDLRKYLEMHLPVYMIPTYFVYLDQLPLTPNNKVDRKALLDLEVDVSSGVEYKPPTNETEATLVKIWSELLGEERIGIDDDFFKIGGNSLSATQLISKMFKEFEVEVPLREMFKSSTIKELAEYINGAEKSYYSKIDLVEEREYYPLSSAQKRLFMLNLLDELNTSYNISRAIVIRGDLDKERLEKVFADLIKRHEAFRTSFDMVNGEPVQFIHRDVDFSISNNMMCSETEIEGVIKDFIRPFDLSKAPLLRVGVIRCEDYHVLVYDMHHIISDGTSFSILIREFINLYNGNHLPELRIQYKDFAVHQNELFESEELKKQEEFWVQTYANEIPLLNMPTDYSRPAVMSYEGDQYTFSLDADLSMKLMKLGTQKDSTLYMTLMALYSILLHKYTGQEDIVIGSPIAGRQHADLENLIGMFVNTLAFRSYPQGEKTFTKFLEEVKENALKAYENQDYQFEMLVEILEVRRDLSRNPIFDTMFTLQNMATLSSAMDMGDLQFALYNFEKKVSKFDLSLTAAEAKEGILFNFEYSTKLFKRETIERLSKHFLNLIKTVLQNPDIQISKIQMILKEEEQLLDLFNDRYTDYLNEKTLQQLFEEQVEKTPQRIAVIFKDQQITYAELNGRANQLARVLRKKGVKSDQIVGLMVERSLEMMIGIIAILKAGGAYLPIDPDFPEERIEYMLKDSKTRILLSQPELAERVKEQVEQIDVTDWELYQGDRSNLEIINEAQNLAYVIYTSGSTGKPKGVMIEHRAVHNFIYGVTEQINFAPDKTILSLTTISFDIFVLETLLPLSKGLKVVIANEDEQRLPECFNQILIKHHVDMLQTTPSRMQLLISDDKNLEGLKLVKEILIGGESFPERLLEELKLLTDARIYNMYGPTETTVWSTIKELTGEQAITIGKPIANTQIHILDQNDHLAPINVPGELCISGDGLARGYLNREELTEEKFVVFDQGQRIYRTGDLARWLPDGNIQHLGRFDNQVKIRGYRIELGEIEAQLLKHEAIEEVAVVDRTDSAGNKYLCAYLVARDQVLENVRDFLAKELPEYMIPSYFMELQTLPLTPNGKLDRRSLPEFDGNIDTNTSMEYVAPSNELEERLAKIWSEVLGIEKIGIYDNFFKVGGHSLKATSMISKISREFAISVPLRQIFKTPTIKGLGEYILSAERKNYSTTTIAEEREYYPVSSAQKRLFILNQLDPGSTVYNMPQFMRIEGELDKEAFKRAFKELVQRHESLRTLFELIDDEPVQRVQIDVDFQIMYQTLEETKRTGLNGVNHLAEELMREFIKPFDLKKAPLVRAGLIEMGENHHLMMFDMHHIISDGVSMSILVNEFFDLYQGKELSPLQIQYKDFAAWQDDLFSSEEFKVQENYWLESFGAGGDIQKEIPVLNLPTDYIRPGVLSYEGARIKFKIDRELTEKLNDIASKQNATMYMILLAAYNILLAKYSNQEDIIIGSPIAGRHHADLEPLIGVFVNTLALRNYPQRQRTFAQFLQEVKENSLMAYESQDYPFERLVEKLDLPRNLSRNPLFDVMFVMHTAMTDQLSLENLQVPGLIFKEQNFENDVVKFDLHLNAIEVSKEIWFVLEYSTKLFKEETIQRMSRHLIQMLSTLAINPEIMIGNLDLISKEEREQLLYDFNDTQIEYPRNKTIHQLFEEQSEKVPQQIAVIFEDQQITYDELNSRANQLARVLREKGVKPDQIVGLMVERSLEMMIGIVAILKAGGAYLPIDPDFPEERIEYMLKDSKTRILLSQPHLAERVKEQIEQIDVTDWELYQGDRSNLEIINKAQNLAYVIYTSGSTGKPKGVMIEHKAVHNFINGVTEQIDFTSDKTILSLTTISFDIFVLETLLPLSKGLKVVIANEDEQRLPESFNQVLIKHHVEMLQTTPSRIQLLISDDKNLEGLKLVKEILIGGESFPERLLEELKLLTDARIYNMYGPTETTVWSTIKELTDEQEITIGNPIANTKIHILDQNNHLAPINVPGELCIAGDGLARGYLNREELTEEKFVVSEHGQRIYRTGDLARWLPDGNIQHLGRIDHQVKIRGYRIELGEIEAQLLKHEGIEEVAVVDHIDSAGYKYLCAYLVARDQVLENVRDFLAKEFPEYMIPSYFMQLETLPLTPSGKLDRLSLPEVDGKINTDREYVTPSNEFEEKLAKIWSEVLGIEKIGIHDNFFEVGGHSLKATSMISKISREFAISVPLRQIFKTSTIKGLGEYISRAERKNSSTITIAEEREYYPVSSAQKRLFILNQLDSGSTVYNMPQFMRIEGELDKEAFERAFKELIGRHESLRTSFELLDDEPVQRVQTDVDFQITYKTLELKRTESNGADHLAEELTWEFTKPFDLKKAPLLRVGLVEMRENYHLMMFDMHHIISDGVSMSILVNEFFDLYRGKELSPLQIQYKDYAAWQNDLFSSEEFKVQESYWLESFEAVDGIQKEIPVLNLPTDYIRPGVLSYEGARIKFKIDRELTKKLNDIASEQNATMYMILLAAYNILLGKYSNQEDIIIGTPIAGRHHADLESLIGVFINTLALRNYPQHQKTFAQFLLEVKENALMAYESQDYPFERLVEKLDLPRNLSRNPLFDVMFVMHTVMTDQLSLENIEVPGLNFTEQNFENNMVKFDLHLNATEVSEEIWFVLEYSTKLFKKETIQRMSGHLIQMLITIATNPEIMLGDLELISEVEREQLLYDFNDTQVDYPRDKTIHQLFEEQVEKMPQRIAAIFEDQQLTYQELNEKSNQLARVLRENGVLTDSIVGIMVERSLEMLIGILGIVKAGGAYLPILPDYPEERIEFLLEDSNTNILLTQNKLISQVKNQIAFAGQIINLDDEELYTGDESNLEYITKPEDLAYVIYTSGSTGKPKGVMIEHWTLMNRLNWMQKICPLDKSDTFLQKTPFTFDVSVQEMFYWIYRGVKLCFLTPGGEKEPEKIVEAIERHQITTLHFVPSMLSVFLDHLENGVDVQRLASLKQVLASGEALQIQHVERFNEYLYKPFGIKLHNLYGPTEATIDVTHFDCSTHEGKANVPIGKPIDNIQIYIVDQKNRLQPLGVPGELCIAGDGLARGYLNRSDLTKEKFVPNPFNPGEKMYKTGDLVRWLSSGNIEFLGRMDHQVKIRGFRIEPGEIEARLLKHNEIKEAVVIPRDDKDGEKYLCAYLVSEKEFMVSELWDWIGKELPEYMIPSYFIRLDEMPLTSNGKLNRKALPEPDGKIQTGIEYVAPSNELEEGLVKIWSEILGIEKIGMNDNFFNMGGHSLKATTLVSKIHKEMNVDISLADIFNKPTIKGLAEFIHSTEKDVFVAIEPAETNPTGYYPVSPAQKRMFILNQYDKESTNYNLPVMLSLNGVLDQNQLKVAFKKLIQRHESLRTGFEIVGVESMQKIYKEVDFEIEYLGLESKQVAIEDQIKEITRQFIRPFDLSKAPLFRVGLVKLAENEHLLMVDMHHIITDGVSILILQSELAQLYEERDLPNLKIQYKDYAVWQNSDRMSAQLKKQEEYWYHQFKDGVSVLKFPTDYSRPDQQSFEGDRVNADLGKELSQKVYQIAQETDTTVYMVLLAVYNVTLYKYTGQSEMIVGTPVAGRTNVDLQSIVGMFVNTVPMKNQLESKETFAEFLKKVKNNTLQAFAHQNYPFEDLIEKINIKREKGRNPLFDVMFALQNIDTPRAEKNVDGELMIKPYHYRNYVTKFDIDFVAAERSESIIFWIDYCVKLFKATTMEHFLKHYIEVLEMITENRDIKIKEIELVTEDEQSELLECFSNEEEFEMEFDI